MPGSIAGDGMILNGVPTHVLKNYVVAVFCFTLQSSAIPWRINDSWWWWFVFGRSTANDYAEKGYDHNKGKNDMR